MSAVVIIPTTGDAKVIKAIESVLDQSAPAKILIVVDGPQFSKAWAEAEAQLRQTRGGGWQVIALPENTGGNGFYGHRIYAAIPHLVNEDHVFFLDQDNWFEPGHVESLVTLLSKGSELAFAYCLRNIVDADGHFLCRDNCESLGKWPVWDDGSAFHIDTSAYAFKRNFLIDVCHLWHRGYGQDRKFFNIVKDRMPANRYGTSGKYTLNYRLGDRPGAAALEFFLRGNRANTEKYRPGPDGIFPWAK